MCAVAFEHAGLDYNKYVVQDQRFYRPAEVDLLVGDPAKAGRLLGWEPELGFKELMHSMVDSDLAKLQSGVRLPDLQEFTTVRF